MLIEPSDSKTLRELRAAACPLRNFSELAAIHTPDFCERFRRAVKANNDPRAYEIYREFASLVAVTTNPVPGLSTLTGAARDLALFDVRLIALALNSMADELGIGSPSPTLLDKLTGLAYKLGARMEHPQDDVLEIQDRLHERGRPFNNIYAMPDMFSRRAVMAFPLTIR